MSEVSANSSPVYNKIIINNETTLVDFSNANAEAKDVIYGKVFHSNSSPTVGTLTAQSSEYTMAIEITPSEEEQIEEAEEFAFNKVTVKAAPLKRLDTIEPRTIDQLFTKETYYGIDDFTVRGMKLIEITNAKLNGSSTTISIPLGYDGIKSVTIAPNLTPKQVYPREEQQKFEVSELRSSCGFGDITVNAAPLMKLNVIPTTSPQILVPESTYYGIKEVTVEPIQIDNNNTFSLNGTYTPEQGKYFSEVTVSVPEPSGNLDIEENGEYDVKNYASVKVNITSQIEEVEEYDGEVTIVEVS